MVQVDEQPPRTWDELADGYDGELGWDETLMGLKLCRWWLVRQAKVSPDILHASMPRAVLLAICPNLHYSCSGDVLSVHD